MDKKTRRQTIKEVFEVLNERFGKCKGKGLRWTDGILRARLDLREYFDKTDKTSYSNEFYSRKGEE